MIDRLVIAVMIFFMFMTVTPMAGSEIAYISNDLGGYVSVYDQRFYYLNRTRTHVIIDGECASACTRYMKLANVCATPNATLWFHAIHEHGKPLVTESILDSKLNESDAAFRLQDKYGVWRFGFVKVRRQPKDVQLEPGVTLAYTTTPRVGVYQKWLKVKATRFIPAC